MDSGDIFKYQRLKGKLGSTIKSENVTSVCQDENYIVLGTARGHMYVFGSNCKLVKSYQAHSGSVSAIAVDPHDLALYSCGMCGTVVLNSLGMEGEDMEVLYTTPDNTPLHAICVEDAPRKRKDKSFIAGLSSGQLIYRRNSWASSSSHKHQRELFPGADSPVSTITWRGSVVAWADATQLRVMEVSSQTAICYLNAPPNIGIENPFPCSLFWDTDMDLLIGWADSFRVLHLVPTSNGNSSSPGSGVLGSKTGGMGVMYRAKLTADWVADSIICAVSSFDRDHALLLGFIPPSNEQEQEQEDEDEKSSVELLCVQKKDGRMLSADLLPLITENDAHNAKIVRENLAPENFFMMSSYSCLLHRAHSSQWIYASPHQRGGYRNLPPKLLILSPHDIVSVKVCDVNDRISHALQAGHLRQAVYLAKKDKFNLRLFSIRDLVNKYLSSLLEDDQADVAAFECSQLLTEVQDDMPGGSLDELWQHWIEEFATRRRLSAIAPHIPTGDSGYYHSASPSSETVATRLQEGSPGREVVSASRRPCRLPKETYALFLSHFLTSNSKAFLQAIQRWGDRSNSVRPPLFDSAEWLEKLKKQMGDTPRGSTQSREGYSRLLSSTGGHSRHRATYRDNDSDEEGDDIDYARADPWLLEAKALLHTYLGQFKRALHCYLAIEPGSSEQVESSVGSEAAATTTPNAAAYDFSRSGQTSKYQHVFDLIEKKKLFREVQGHVLRLVQFSKTLSEGLLIRNMDQLPVFTVVQQLKADPILLHWYLHTLFTKAPDVYNSQEYSECHLTQVSLYAHFAPKYDPIASDVNEIEESKSEGTADNSDRRPLIVLPSSGDSTSGSASSHNMHQIEEQSDFLKFLKYSSFVPLEVALRECEKQSPPLYREIVFILAKMGCVKEGLLLLLRELGDVQLAVKYIELYGPEHWDLIVDHALSHHEFLGKLLDLIGFYNRFDPMTLVGKLPPCMEIPDLRQRLSRLLSHCNFQNFLQGRCLGVLQEDTLSELRQLNRSQRKAIKVMPSASRCVGCGRPTSMLPPSYSSLANKTAPTTATATTTAHSLSSDSPSETGFSGAASRLGAQERSINSSKNSSDVLEGHEGHGRRGGDWASSGSSVDNIWGLPVASVASTEASHHSQRTIPSMAHIHDAIVYFPNKVAYHISCFYHGQGGHF